ncbi:hypothetical protein [Rhodococcus sovatensis]|uniref:Uncharacterized protein n=1 Tax=Rhodococcus sovatensis TaxID=1805840 RepID=A0ABZ2PJL6_9NOCA
MAERKVYEGEVLGSGKKTVSALDGFAALNQLVDAARECITIHATENTKQRRIETYASVELAKIKTAETVLKDYFEKSFTERRATFDQLFANLDRALDQGNSEVVSAVLDSIVDIAKSSPLANAGDLSQIRNALDDPNHVWEI